MRDSPLFDPCFGDMRCGMVNRLDFDPFDGYQIGYKQSEHVKRLLSQVVVITYWAANRAGMALTIAVRTARPVVKKRALAHVKIVPATHQ